jgi:hypothetical protein
LLVESESPVFTNLEPTCILTTLEYFRYDVELGILKWVRAYEETWERLAETLDTYRFKEAMATQTISNIQEQLASATLKLLEVDSEENRGEVKCWEMSMRCAQASLNTVQKKCSDALIDWQAQCSVTLEITRAKQIVCNYFKRMVDGNYNDKVAKVSENTRQASLMQIIHSSSPDVAST